MDVKSALAGWLRRRADRLDPDGAPRRTSWCFTFEDGWGAVFNQDGRGCPLWYYGSFDYARAHLDKREAPDACDIHWVVVGSDTPGGVSVLGSAEVTDAVLTRRINGHDEVKVPNCKRPAKVPRWRITLRCDMDSWVSLPGTSFQDAVGRVFKSGGRTS